MAWGLCHRHRFPSRADRPYRSRRDRSLIDGTFELFRYAAGRWPVIGAGAIALGVLGAVAGDAVGDQLDDTLSHGLPTDELYVYRDALQKGRSIVIVMVEDDAQATQVRQLIAGLARRAWTPPGRSGGSASAMPRRRSTRARAAISARTSCPPVDLQEQAGGERSPRNVPGHNADVFDLRRAAEILAAGRKRWI
jgi:hypothetical protein